MFDGFTNQLNVARYDLDMVMSWVILYLVNFYAISILFKDDSDFIGNYRLTAIIIVAIASGLPITSVFLVKVWSAGTIAKYAGWGLLIMLTLINGLTVFMYIGWLKTFRRSEMLDARNGAMDSSDRLEYACSIIIISQAVALSPHLLF